MIGYTAIKEKLFGSTTAKGEDQSSDAAAIVERAIKPSRRFKIGRQVAFAFDEDSVQAASVFRFGKLIRVINVDKVYLPSSLGSSENRANFVASTISNYIREFGGLLPTVSLAVSGQETAFRTFLMPALKKKELEAAIRFEVGKQIPFPRDNCVYDYRVISQVCSDDRKRLRISLSAITRRQIMGQLRPFYDSSVPINIIYHAPEVLGRLLQRLPYFNPDANYTLMNLTRHRSEIYFFRGTNLEFFQSSAGAATILGDHPNLTESEFYLESILKDVRTAFDFYGGQHSGNLSSRIYIYGDLAFAVELQTSGGQDHSLEFIRFPTELLDLEKSGKQDSHLNMAVCLSALAAAVNNERAVNLLPEELAAAHRSKKRSRYAAAAFASLVIILSVAWGMLHDRFQSQRAELNQLTTQISSFKNSTAFHMYVNMKKLAEVDKAYLASIIKKPSYLNLGLKELSLLTPSSIKLLHFDYNSQSSERNLSLQGIVRTTEIPPEIVLAEYIESLGSSPFFEEVKIIRHIKRVVQDGFELEFSLELRELA